ncbi:uncharacterized protein LOC127364666 [Dicentrarchus labrax]|uniref:uncharacterized protein LOC127364666 n=1 Tax=Dicentrarchus labrax TaxID=13489 RepID=UPI0021F51AFB|nr:uncharacterized protein LOC127364666 [Dicentrarchus labrax]
MAENDQYPVYFECDGLLEEQLHRIEKYFRIRRRSGGGDCGPLRRVRDQIYSVAFKYQRDQQAVLQKSEHHVGGLVFTVRSSLEPRTSSSITTSTASQDFTAPLQSPLSIPASTLLPSGEEYELRLDSYLFRYLKECPEAEEDLKEGLASVACSAQLYPEEERVVVRSLAQPGAVDENRNWKAEVDKLFAGYPCHYEMDPHKIKSLLQSCSSRQTTDDVKVYTEFGFAVVVGELSQVKARLMDVEDRSRLGERTTTICRLGEAKLRLLWKEIEHSLGRDFPGVKVMQGDSGQLVLEGSVEEILKAGEWITDKENLVLERKVSDISPRVLASLKNAYGGPGALVDFLGVGDKVEVELRDTEIRLFSLSADNLDKTEKALQGAIKEVKMNVAQNLASLSLSEENITVASYSLCDGLQVLVCQGDITKQHADALVNAANEDLDHCGGVAAALSKAGGPEVQRESNALIKYIGKIPTGDVVVTTGGNLNCKILLHAVGPVGGKSGGNERALLKQTVQSALDLSEIMGFNSIAMPCISSGVFGVPVNVCSEAIVTAVKEFGSQGGRSLSRIILIDNREEVVRSMHEACDRLLQGIHTGTSAPSDLGFQVDAADLDTARGATAGAGESVRLEIIQGTIEAQQVDAVVSPMVGHDPLSTRVGNILYKMVGSQLTARFGEEAKEETLPGDTVLVDGLPGLLSNAVFFINLVPWDDDEDGIAVQVLRLGISNIMTSCENRGFGSVALPVLGAGIALSIPDTVVARVLHEEVQKFEQNRNSRTPLRVSVVIHPSDEESREAFKSPEEAFQPKEFTKEVYQPDQVSATKRIVLLGKTGAGKSHLADTIFGEELFTPDHSPNSGTTECQAKTKSVNGRSITLIDTPGFFDVERPEEELKPEIVKCITECAPGPHAFLIVLKVEKFTEHEQAVITKICQYFSEDALKYAVVVFTHGNQLPKGMNIEDFVRRNKNLSDLVKKCGGRCHVVDNKYWNNSMQNNYRSNQFQVEELLSTIDKMVMENRGGYYINKLFQAVEKEIQKEIKHIKQSSGNMPEGEIRKQAKTKVSNRFMIQLAGIATGTLVGALCGLAAMVGLAITAMQSVTVMKLVKCTGATAALGGEVAIAAGVGAATIGGVVGGMVGSYAAEKAETPLEAAQMAYNDVINKGKDAINQIPKMFS